jgi:hypothetical protein
VAWGQAAEKLVARASDWPGAQAAAALPAEVWAPFNALQRRYSRLVEGADSLLAEAPRAGLRASAFGYSWGGKARVLAVHGPPEASVLRAAIEPLIRRLIEGMGFDNGAFGVDLLCDPARNDFAVMDVRPGGGPWETALDLALGLEPAKRP